MITQLQDSLGKHHRTLLGALLVVIIGSFVFYGYGTSGRGESAGSLLHATASGTVNLTDARSTRDARDLAAFLSRSVHGDDFLQAAKIAALRQRAGNGDAEDARGDRAFAFLVDTVDRLAAADALQIPQPGEKELAAFIRSNPAFAGPTGEFDPVRLKEISDMARDRLGLDESRLQGALANAWRLARLAAAASPEDAPALDTLAARLRDTLRTKWRAEAALYSRSGYAPLIPADEAALAAYFEVNKETYRVPKRLKLRVARLAGLAPDASGKPTDDDLLATAERRKDKFPLFGSVSNPTFILDNRTALEATWRDEKSGEAAAAKASETLLATMPLGEGRPDTAAVETMLKAASLTATSLPVYGPDAIPAVPGVPEALLSRALALSPQRWRTAAIPFGDAAFVFLYDDTVPSRLPSLDEVRARVLADRNGAETERLFAESATVKAAEVASAVMAGKPFAAAAESAGLKLVPIADFERQSAPEKLASHLESLESTPAGGVSQALRSGTDRLVVHIVSRTVEPAAKDEGVTASYRRLLGTAAARSTAEAAPGAAE